ncbi:hypothetical protein M378DRAFT_6610 [Amanita muscaria Koide BX008]|uniref:Uncharacterized protein n=1 Tax=Amanita muscaria (strain Koide BX008) TaxID=946122 RepID=A0A0C2XM93_AMAMK|nr:hypothetical protein M378DRAFT_6610 [Amanita muscaria Koide BX008]
MATTTETDSGSHSSSEYLKDTHVDCISQSLSKTNLQAHAEEYRQREKSTASIPPVIVYTRSQLLSLHNSPLVRPPLNMPELKDWFGSDLDQPALKKEAESQSSGARERRFRRDADDGDSRPSFRSAISQPSQMGNFKHQSLRTNDRDKERDRDGDRERDLRDREGQERLRHLSDKYDRDRSMTLSGSGVRGKERDGAPNTSSRLSSQGSTATSRRTENRDGTKKKSGEVADDWRRIGEPSRSGREESRRDRDDRERPRSRIRDSSRPRREASTTRRERDEKDRRDDNVRERTSRADRDRDEYRRDRDRELDKDSEHDDPRHWRDDGKRDERVAARRDRERARERDVAWDSANDRRWTADERDSRTKRSTRDKKPLQSEDVKDREERKDRDRDREKEREKEKEPAWMDTYIPSGPSFGILGGKGADGELDGIQAWKKGMKEKEQREKGIESTTPSNGGQDQPNDDHSISEKTDGAEKQLDEIQLFKLLMKREEEKRKMDMSSSTVPDFVNSSLSFHDDSGSATIHSASPKEISQPLNDSYNLGQDQPPTSRDSLKAGSDHLNTSLDESVSARNTPRSRYITQPENRQNVGKPGSESVATYNPPSASRLLSLGRPPNPSNSAHLNASDSLYGHGAAKVEGSRPAPGFSPFEEATRGASVEDPLSVNVPDTLRRLHVERSSANVDVGHLDSAAFEINPSYPGPRGSRFAKFFDNKSRDSAPLPKSQTPVGLVSSSPHPGQRPEQNPYESLHGTTAEPRTLEDIFAMLNNSSQGHRHIVNPPISQQAQNNLQLLYQQQSQQLQAAHRLEPLYESRLDDRNFVPDGMVPGLRTAPTPRSREPPSLYSDGLEDIVHHNIQQRSSQQRLDSIYSAPPPMFNQRNVGIPIQQAHYRGGASPISAQQGPLQNTQRLPPGLANLGGRPPHDQSQFLNVQGVPTPSLHGTAGLNGPPQQQNYNTFTPGVNFSGPFRGPLPAHQPQNSLTHHAMGGNSVNPQAQFLALNGVGMSGLRGLNNGLGPQQGQNTHLHNPLVGVRQQQQPLHPHALPHMMPPHLSQQGLASQANQPAHDLMALLMGGPHRE